MNLRPSHLAPADGTRFRNNIGHIVALMERPLPGDPIWDDLPITTLSQWAIHAAQLLRTLDASLDAAAVRLVEQRAGLRQPLSTLAEQIEDWNAIVSAPPSRDDDDDEWADAWVELQDHMLRALLDVPGLRGEAPALWRTLASAAEQRDVGREAALAHLATLRARLARAPAGTSVRDRAQLVLQVLQEAHGSPSSAYLRRREHRAIRAVLAQVTTTLRDDDASELGELDVLRLHRRATRVLTEIDRAAATPAWVGTRAG